MKKAASKKETKAGAEQPKKTPTRYVKPKTDKINYDRLNFLKKVIGFSGVKQADIAALLGMTTGGVSQFLKVGDLKISYAKKIVDFAGFELSFYFASDNEEIMDAQKRKDPGIQFYGNSQLENLGFLNVAMRSRGYSVKMLSEKLEIPQATTFYWFQNDDMMISRLYQIAQVFDLTLIISVNKKKKEREDDERTMFSQKAKVVTEFSLSDVSEI